MEVAAIFLPLLAAFIAGLFGRWIGDRGAQIVTCGALILSAAISVFLFIDVGLHGHNRVIELFTFIASGTFEVSWALRFDSLTVVMLIVVTVVSAAVHVYSVGYMAHDHHKPRFMAYLSLFTFFMLMLVTANNFVQLFFGWEGVGLCSYLLIGFWYEKPSACSAAMKAFIVNRVGDFGFALGIAAVFVLFGSVDFATVFAKAPSLAGQSFTFLSWQADALTVTCLLLFMGAMGKSAQLGLHTWLPDAMEGPTPVSALIHAATMVTAGVFMVARLSPMFEYAPIALGVVTVVGAATALIAGTIGMTQFDIKRVIAYSTMSQLGYMFFACGVSAYGAGIFHLLTHGFFKALLFLGAGSVIHAMSDEQDMRNMGGIWKLIPFTYGVMWVGSLALAGIPIFAGFYSKDAILEAAFASGTELGAFAFWVGVGAALLTAFYSWRLLFLTFHGKPRANERVMAHVHESPLVMTIPLGVLALGSIFAGMLFAPILIGEHRGDFWQGSLVVLGNHDSIEAAHHGLPAWIEHQPLIAGLSGIFIAFLCYVMIPDLPGKFVRLFRPLHNFFLRKWYFDELYDAMLVKPALVLGRGLWKTGDGAIIDGFGPDGVAARTRAAAARAASLESGYVFHYAFAMVIGLVVIITWFFVRG
ncbi:MAG: NADH-quinone oxidoreductase subunit L [Azospirillum sp.]|nr:NADH-quinone oxidoreductase subunit L [Azospirillum sp.]